MKWDVSTYMLTSASFRLSNAGHEHTIIRIEIIVSEEIVITLCSKML